MRQIAFQALVEGDWYYFVKLLIQDSLESDCPETRFQVITSSGQYEKIAVRKTIKEFWTAISNQMIKLQLPHTQLDQISDPKLDIYLYIKLSTKLLVFPLSY